MACDTRLRFNQKIDERKREVDASVKRLEAAIGSGKVKVVVGPTGSIVFVDWNEADRDGVSDACAFRKLTQTGSWAFRQALARAEATAGRKVDEKQVTAGTHSHDGGKTWHKGH